MRAHNYEKKLWRLYELGLIPAASVNLVDIYHDDWCDIYRGGRCNCDPHSHVRTVENLDPRRN